MEINILMFMNVIIQSVYEINNADNMLRMFFV